MSVLFELSTDGFFLVIDGFGEPFLKAEDLGLFNKSKCILFFGHFLFLCDFDHLVDHTCRLGVIVDFSVALGQQHEGFCVLFARLLL
jgi:hypothetical protein